MAGFTFAAVEFVAMPIVTGWPPPSIAARAGPGAILASGRRGAAAVLAMTKWPSLARGGSSGGGAVGGLVGLADNRYTKSKGHGVR